MPVYISKNIFLTLLILVLTSLIYSSPIYSAYDADMADVNPQFNFRFDGANVNDQLGYYAINTADFDQDGKLDLVIGARQNAAESTCTETGPYDCNLAKGEAYLIYGSKLDEFEAQGKGYTIDLNNPDNWNIKFVGATQGESGARLKAFADIDNDGKQDIFFGSLLTSNLGLAVGSMHIIYNSLFDDDSSNGEAAKSGCTVNVLDPNHDVGCVVDLAQNLNWNVRIDGEVFTPFGQNYPVGGALATDYELFDFNQNGKMDLFISAPIASPSNLYSGFATGALYLLYNERISGLSGTGNIINLGDPDSFDVRLDGAAFRDALGWINTDVADINQDGALDLITGAPSGTHGSASRIGQLYIIDNSIISGLSGVNSTLDMSNPNNYSLKFVGEYLDVLSYASAKMGDLNNNDQPDLLVGAPAIDHSEHGSLYVIYDDILTDNYASPGNPGNVLNISNTANWSIRYDSLAGVGNSVSGSLNIVDLDNDGKNDLIFGDEGGAPNGQVEAGEWYVIFNTTISQHSGTGNVVDLSDSSNYDIRYMGANSGDGFGYADPQFADINNDGITDVIAPAWEADPEARSGAGSVYVINYFPHEINPNIANISLGQEFDFTGTVNAPDNVTTISKVQFGHRQDFGQTNDPTEFHTFWWDCTPVVGVFDSNNEQYTCHHAALTDNLTSPFHSPHVAYMRAQDEKGIWTPVSRYVPVLFSAEQMCFPN